MDERTHDFGMAGSDYATDAGAGGDLYASPSAEADALEARAREIRARATEAADIEAERGRIEQAGIRSREASDAHRFLLFAASQCISRAAGNAIQISALLTMTPDRIEEMDSLVATAARNLADFRSNLSAASEIGVTLDGSPDRPRNPGDELPGLYGTALDRVREVHRQYGAMVDLLGSDMCNTPALVAMARLIDEAQMLSVISLQGLGLVLHELGMTR